MGCSVGIFCCGFGLDIYMTICLNHLSRGIPKILWQRCILHGKLENVQCQTNLKSIRPLSGNMHQNEKKLEK